MATSESQASVAIHWVTASSSLAVARLCHFSQSKGVWSGLSLWSAFLWHLFICLWGRIHLWESGLWESGCFNFLPFVFFHTVVCLLCVDLEAFLIHPKQESFDRQICTWFLPSGTYFFNVISVFWIANIVTFAKADFFLRVSLFSFDDFHTHTQKVTWFFFQFFCVNILYSYVGFSFYLCFYLF